MDSSLARNYGGQMIEELRERLDWMFRTGRLSEVDWVELSSLVTRTNLALRALSTKETPYNDANQQVKEGICHEA